jgi:hypothetical protein
MQEVLLPADYDETCMQPTVTDELVLRGNFQTLPIAIYGWALSTHAAPDVSCSQLLIRFSPCQNLAFTCAHDISLVSPYSSLCAANKAVSA